MRHAHRRAETGLQKKCRMNTFYEKEGADMYTIGQVAEMFGVPVSTLRYYDKEGLFPEMRRASASSAKRR